MAILLYRDPMDGQMKPLTVEYEGPVSAEDVGIADTPPAAPLWVDLSEATPQPFVPLAGGSMTGDLRFEHDTNGLSWPTESRKIVGHNSVTDSMAVTTSDPEVLAPISVGSPTAPDHVVNRGYLKSDRAARASLAWSSGWDVYGGEYLNETVFRQDGMVWLETLAKRTSTLTLNPETTYPICTVPAEFAPTEIIIFAGLCTFTSGVAQDARIDVKPDGTVNLNAIFAGSVSSGGWVSLHICWRANN